MDTQANNVQLVTEANIEQVTSVIDEMLSAKREMPSNSKFEYRILRLVTALQQHGIILFFIQIVLAVIYYYWQSYAGLVTMTLFGVFSMLCGFSLILLGIVAPIPFLLRVRKKPYGHFMLLVKNALDFDLTYAYRLSLCNINALEYVLVQFSLERNALEKRGAILSGNIEKIGLFPAIAGTAILYITFAKMSFGNGWLQIFPPIILAFHLLNLWIGSLLQKQDRAIAILGYVIKMEQ
ncbi:hypothetical protein [Undibacterium sp. Xuan67W]|uniref:hypothetical protein n=1 Tax=Undibacterium sp. Xuan67W TaxID=3413057 RepID=UPI003BF3F377